MTKRIVSSFQMTEADARKFDALESAGFGTRTDIIRIAIDRMYREEIAVNTRNITQSWLQSWIDTNRPDLGLYETNGVKGFYKLDAGPAHSFRGVGKTWRQVAAELEAIVVQDAE